MGKPQGFARMPSRRHGAALHTFRHGSSHFILGHFPSLYLTAIVKTETWTAGLQQCWLKDRARRSSQVTDGRTANMFNCLTSTWDGTNKKPSLQLEAVWRKWRNLKPRGKGQKQAGRVKREGRCGERTVCEEWGDMKKWRISLTMLMMLTAKLPMMLLMLMLTRRCPQAGLSHGKTACDKARGGKGG